MRKKWIQLPLGESKKLAIEFNTHKVTVSNALNFKANSNHAKMLRKAALERGGKLIELD